MALAAELTPIPIAVFVEIDEAPPSRLERVGLLAERVARLRLARARGKCAPLRQTPPQFSAVASGLLAKDPVPPIAIAAGPERPSSSVRPRIGYCSKKKLAKHRPAGSSGSVCWRSASLGSASRAREMRAIKANAVALIFRCRRFGDTPYLPARAPRVGLLTKLGVSASRARIGREYGQRGLAARRMGLQGRDVRPIQQTADLAVV